MESNAMDALNPENISYFGAKAGLFRNMPRSSPALTKSPVPR